MHLGISGLPQNCMPCMCAMHHMKVTQAHQMHSPPGHMCTHAGIFHVMTAHCTVKTTKRIWSKRPLPAAIPYVQQWPQARCYKHMPTNVQDGHKLHSRRSIQLCPAARSRRNSGVHEPSDQMPLIICHCHFRTSLPTRHVPAQSTSAARLRDVCLSRGQHEGQAPYTPRKRQLTACQAQPHTDAAEQSVDDMPDR